MRVALSACAGPGKTALIGWLGWHFMAFMGGPGCYPKGALVSETEALLYSTLWPEMHKWRSRSPYLTSQFEMTNDRLFQKDHKEEWFLDARTWPRSASDDEQGRTLSGIHGPYVFFGIDECGAIPPAVARAANQALVDRDLVLGRIVIAGNPLTRKGMLYDATVTHAEQWTTIRITGDPDNPRRSPRVDINEARNNIREFGRDNPWVKAYVFGEFPDADFTALLSPEEVEKAMKRTCREQEFSFAARIMGVDVAFQGDDRTVITKRQGRYVMPQIILRGMGPAQVAARVAQEWIAWDADACFVDNSGGWGGGVVDQLVGAKFRPTPINFSESALDPRFANIRSEMWWKMADHVKADLVLPYDSRTLPFELSAPNYSLQKGRFLLEPKDQFKKRIGTGKPSPDCADSLALTYAREVAPRVRLRGPGAEGRGVVKVKTAS